MSRLPSKDEILAWISDNPAQGSKRDIAKAFGVKGARRIDLKRLLKELEAEGHLEKRRRNYRDPDKLPPVSVLQVLGPDDDGDIFARPLEWRGDGPEPRVLYSPRDADPAVGEGDRILARLQEIKGEDHHYVARLIRRIATNPRRILGVFRAGAEGGRIMPIAKGADKEWRVGAGDTYGAKDGELVEAEQAGPGGRMGLPRARVTERLGDPGAPRSVSLIAIHEHGIPDALSEDALAEADAAKPAGPKGRKDLRDLPLITIDPSDARDHDDAVFAQADPDPANPGGHIIWVAIADVAAYVTPGSELDREAKRRGNSTYFPDRVVPMLPERLSGDLCSLHEGEPRPVIAVRMVIDAQGQKLAHDFHRGLMRSPAALSYEAAQALADAAADGDADTNPIRDTVVRPLFAAYESLKSARAKRQPLDLDLPERQIVLAADGRVASVAFKDRLDAHKLIEEMMVLANVCAAETLISKRQDLLFRVHEEPDAAKIDALRETAEAAGFSLAKGQVLKTAQLNRLLQAAGDSDHADLINYATLRSMTQAYYFPENFGHFGLALRSYAHFTSPIRRYADLVVHRALIAAHGWGKDGLSEQERASLEETGKHISSTERRSMQAERDTTDRYLAAYLSDRVGAEFSGRISGIARFGAFVRLDETGADGLLPIRAIGAEYFHFDADAQSLMGADSGTVITAGDRVLVRLAEAVPVTGGLSLELLEIDGISVARGPHGKGRGRMPARKAGQVRAKRSKLRKKKATARRR
ncbi:MAG: ribonuclease R [Pseudomonadota bacterium]